MAYVVGEEILLTAGDFYKFAERNLITSAEAADLLYCTRQNIEKLIEKGKPHPVKRLPKSTLLLRSEVEQRKAGA